MVPEPPSQDLRRLNKEGRPFKKGDVREGGFVFVCYVRTVILNSGFYKEKWLSPKAYKKQIVDQRKAIEAWHKKRTKERRELIDSIKLSKGCLYCGYKAHAVALDFDHLDPTIKEFNISQNYITAPLKNLIKEIKKCQVLCANCHRVKTKKDLVAQKG
jgi:5-methylcytosine-specific restriction endonuclease McrA